MKSIGNIAKYTLLAIWLIAVSIAIAIVINQATVFDVDGRVVQKENLNLKPTDTLLIQFSYNDYFANSINDQDDFKITPDSLGNNVIYSNNVSFKIVKTNEKLAYIKIEKEAKGKTLFEAKERAKNIKYGYQFIGNQLILDNYLIADLKEKFRDQKIEITLYLAKGTLFKVDSSVQDYDCSDNDFFNLDTGSSDYLYQVNDNQVKCLDCLMDENEYNDGNPINPTIVLLQQE